MPTGQDLVNQAEKTIGCEYVLGADVPMDDPNYRGAFDCAEKITFDARWVTGKLYGCVDNSDWGNPEPFTGGWWQDTITKRVRVIPVAQAAITPGAIVLRRGAGAGYGHIIMATGIENGTIEAMNRRSGVCRGSLADRRWTCGILLPFVDYEQAGLGLVVINQPKVYHLVKPYMCGPVISAIQEVLGLPTDGIYGPLTRNAVARFQETHGLVVDGEVGPQTLREMGID